MSEGAERWLVFVREDLRMAALAMEKTMSTGNYCQSVTLEKE
jgi:hypothetical protein